MKDHQDSNHENLLEQSTRALCQTPVPDGPPEDSLAEVVVAIEKAANQPRTLSFTERILAMKSRSQITAAAASLLIIGGALAWMLTAGGGANVALADVASVLDKIRSATFTGTMTTEDGEPITGKNMYLEPSRCRSESSRGMIMIYNNSKMVTLVPEKKIAVVFDLENVPKDGLVKNWLEDMRQQIHEAIAGSKDDVEELGRRQVDGREAVGFRLRVENKELTVWADPITAFPIRVEGTSGIMEPRYHHVMSDFRFNVELDESLFSTEPPEGYTVQEASMDASKPREQDLVEVLRIYTTEHEDDLFPSTLNGNEIQEGASLGIEDRLSEKFGDWRADGELRKKVMESEEFKEYMALAMKLGRGMGFLQEGLPPDADWHYAGKGVKLDAPDRPIFWYRPADSKNYRVIYADLSVQEVAAEELKGFPEAVGPEE